VEVALSLSGIDFVCKIMRGQIPAPPIIDLIDFRLVKVEPGEVNGEFEPAEFHYNPVGGVRGGSVWASPVLITDARAMASPPTIHVAGFELCDVLTSMVDFHDEDAIRRRYYAEAAELAKHVTGAHAYIFERLVRRREVGRPALSFGRHGDGTHPGGAGRVHNDYSEASGPKRFEIVALNNGIRSPVRRFAIVNIWRSIRGKLLDTPLAGYDARTISAKDLMVTDILSPGRTGEIYLVRQSSCHQWAYFSEMDSSEALVFKQYDLQVSGVARFTPHSAFDFPDIPPDAPLRESIEIRCLVTYD
jgi:hypothetical protein